MTLSEITDLKEAKAMVRNLLSDKARLLQQISDAEEKIKKAGVTIKSMLRITDIELQKLCKEIPFLEPRLRSIIRQLEKGTGTHE